MLLAACVGAARKWQSRPPGRRSTGLGGSAADKGGGSQLDLAVALRRLTSLHPLFAGQSCGYSAKVPYKPFQWCFVETQCPLHGQCDNADPWHLQSLGKRPEENTTKSWFWRFKSPRSQPTAASGAAHDDKHFLVLTRTVPCVATCYVGLRLCFNTLLFVMKLF